MLIDSDILRVLFIVFLSIIIDILNLWIQIIWVFFFVLKILLFLIYFYLSINFNILFPKNQSNSMNYTATVIMNAIFHCFFY